MSDIVQQTFDYGLLSPEQAQRTQDAEYRIIGRTQKTIVENGRDLLAVKQDIGHGHFLNWIRSVGISEDSAERSINIAKNFGEIPHGAEFSDRALYLLSTSKVPEAAREEAKERAASGEKITEEIAKQIRDAHKAKNDAEKLAKEALEREEHTQQQLFQLQANAEKAVDALNAQIVDLQQEIASIVAPEPQTKEVIKEVIPKKTKKQLEDLQAKQKKLIEERDRLAEVNLQQQEHMAKMRQDIDIALQKREKIEQDDRIRQAWRMASSEANSILMRILGQWPTPLDVQAFDADDWVRLDHLKNTLRRVLLECEGLQHEGQVVDMNTYAVMTVDAD